MVYTCPMHPEVESPAPVACPKCGMTLELKTPAAEHVEWTCPMHPAIIRSEPGACPKCGMVLEPREVGSGEDQEKAELKTMTNRFWISAPVLVLAMGADKQIDPVFGMLLSPMIAAAAMTFNSLSVIGNALRLRRAHV